MTVHDRVALLGAPWGGQATSLSFGTFLNGAALVPFNAVDNGVVGLADWLNERRISVYHSAASYFRHLMKTVDRSASFPHMRILRVGADAARWEDVADFRRHFPNARLINAMGASEVGPIASVVVPLDDSPGEGRLPLGPPHDDLDVRIVDEDGHECPPGTTGILTVRSRFLSLGYWRDPELTARHFSQDPDGTRTFRSSDLACIGRQRRHPAVRPAGHHLQDPRSAG